jgi:hypothetical protein
MGVCEGRAEVVSLEQLSSPCALCCVCHTMSHAVTTDAPVSSLRRRSAGTCALRWFSCCTGAWRRRTATARWPALSTSSPPSDRHGPSRCARGTDHASSFVPRSSVISTLLHLTYRTPPAKCPARRPFLSGGPPPHRLRTDMGRRGGRHRSTVEIHYSGMKDVYKTKSFRCQHSGTRLYPHSHTHRLHIHPLWLSALLAHQS